MKLSCRSMSAPLRDVLVRHPAVAFRSQAELDASWRRYGYTECPDFLQACRDFDGFAAKIERAGATVHFMDDKVDAGIDSIYVHDPVLTVGAGFVIGRMGKPHRRVETKAMAAYCRAHGFDVYGQVASPGLIEGGDVIWLDDDTLAIGLGYRTNAEGIRQLREICNRETAPHEGRTVSTGGVPNIVSVPLPHFRGPGDVLHLMSLISPIGPDTAVVHRPLLPVPFLRLLEERGVTLLDVPEDEFDLLGCNVLALSPTSTLLADSAPKTHRLLERSGFEVHTFAAGEISLKGQGGPTCLTRPLVRQ